MRNAPETPILVKADRSVAYGYVIGGMVLFVLVALLLPVFDMSSAIS